VLLGRLLELLDELIQGRVHLPDVLVEVLMDEGESKHAD